MSILVGRWKEETQIKAIPEFECESDERLKRRFCIKKWDNITKKLAQFLSCLLPYIRSMQGFILLMYIVKMCSSF